MENDAEKDGVLAKSKKRNGRHEETRTPDLYRVKALSGSVYNNLQELRGLLESVSGCKFEHLQIASGWTSG
jgi:hypothetical protein